VTPPYGGFLGAKEPKLGRLSFMLQISWTGCPGISAVISAHSTVKNTS